MHAQRLIPLKLWHVSLSVYHKSVKKQRVMLTVCSHATVTFNTLDTAWNSFRGSGYWMFAGMTGIFEALRGVDVDVKTSCRSCTLTIRNIYMACFKCSGKTFTMLEFWPHTSRNSDYLALTPSANGKREEFHLQWVNLSICGLKSAHILKELICVMCCSVQLTELTGLVGSKHDEKAWKQLFSSASHLWRGNKELTGYEGEFIFLSGHILLNYVDEGWS